MLPSNDADKQKVLKAFEMIEIKLIYQLYNNIILGSKNHSGIDRDAFNKFCLVPGLWNYLLF